MLYGLAEHCSYRELHEEMIRDRIVVGLRDPSLSDSLQLVPTLNLEKAVTKVRHKKQQPLIRSAGGSRVGSEALGVVQRKRKSGLPEIVNKHRRQPILRLIGSLMPALGVESRRHTTANTALLLTQSTESARSVGTTNLCAAPQESVRCI